MRWLREPDVLDPIRFLDSVAQRLEAGQEVAESMETLSDGLWWLRRHWVVNEWGLPPLAQAVTGRA